MAGSKEMWALVPAPLFTSSEPRFACDVRRGQDLPCLFWKTNVSKRGTVYNTDVGHKSGGHRPGIVII